jgi:hypothetical protein
MTPAADAALSHISWQRSQAPLVEICRRKFNAPASNQIDARSVRRSGHLFRFSVHGSYELSAGTAWFPGYSINRITCSNLVLTDDDFVCQYF